MSENEADDTRVKLGETTDQVALSKALDCGRDDWGDVLVLQPETLISELSGEHLDLIEGVAGGVDSVDSLAQDYNREVDIVRTQVGTLVESYILDYDEEDRLVIPHETVVAGPLIASDQDISPSENK